MGQSSKDITSVLMRDVDANACVENFDVRLSPYLSSSYALHKANILDAEIILAEPENPTSDFGRLIKGANALNKALGANIVLYLPDAPTRAQRKVLLDARQAFITRDGSYYIPQLALSLIRAQESAVKQRRNFNPTQQLVFLYCLYTNSGQQIEANDIQKALALSSGSVSYALSAFEDYGLIQYTTGGKTGRKKSYYVEDKARFYRKGINFFGNPVKETLEAPLSCVDSSWLKSGLSALSEQSDLLPPNKPYFAISPKQAKELTLKADDGEGYCNIQFLRYDPALFAEGGCVDPLTMLLTIDEEDERISIALKQALGGFEWYQD
jgi:DNA-binding MarR family transcriptional regulator